MTETRSAEPITGQLLGSCPGFERGYCRAVSVVGNRAYAALTMSTFGRSRLLILDVSDPSDIKPLGSFETNGQANDVEVVGNLAYVADGFAGLLVLDVSNPAPVRRVGSFNPRLDPSDGTTVYFEALQLLGNRAYVYDTRASFDVPDVIQVLEITDPANIRRLGVLATGAPAQRVQIVGNRAYIATGLTLEVQEVSDPANARRLGSFTLPSAPNRLCIEQDRAYVATYFNGVQVLDVSDPAGIRVLGSVNIGRDVAVVAVIGNRAYTAYGTNLEALDMSDPANIRKLGNLPTNSSAESMQVVGNLAYVAAGNDFEVLDVSNAARMRKLGDFPTSGDAVDVQVIGGRAYVAEGGAGLQVLDITDPARLRRVGGLIASGYAQDVQVVGDRAFVTEGHRVVVLDVSDSRNLRRVGSFTSGGFDPVFQVIGDRAYVADSALQIFDVSDSANVRRLGRLEIGGKSFAIQVASHRAYVANSGLQVFDVSDPANPRRLGQMKTGSVVRDVEVVGNVAYVAAAGLEVFDISDPDNPRRLLGAANRRGELAPMLIGPPRTPEAYAVRVVGNVAYVTELYSGLQAWDVSDPANPKRLGGFQFSNGQASPGLQVVGNVAFVANRLGGLLTIKLAGGPGFAPGLLQEPRSLEAPPGATVTLQVSAVGTEPFQYRWRKDGADLGNDGRRSGNATASLTIKALQVADLGSYSVLVANGAGSVTSAPAVLKFQPFRVAWAQPTLPSQQSSLLLKISGALPGDTVVVSRSVDLLSWAPWLTNVAATGVWETEVPWLESEPRWFYRAASQQ